MIKTEELQTFVHIVDRVTITAAAARLGLAKSAVSRRLSELEDELGVELFHRTTRKLTLTDSGRGFYHRAIRILADLHEAQAAVSRAHRELSGQLRIAAPFSFGMLHLGPAIVEFQQLHPKLNFDIDFNDRQVDLIQEGFDLGIRIAVLKDSSLIARKLARASIVVCASPDYLAKRGTPLTPDDLAEHHCMTYSYLQHPNRWQFVDQQGAQTVVTVPSTLQSNNGDFIRQAATSGLGVLRQPTFITYESIARGDIVPILQDYTIPHVNIYAIYPPTRHLSQRVRTFIDFLIDRFAGVPYWEKCLL